MKPKYGTTPRFGVGCIRKPGLDASRFVREGQGPDWSWQGVRQSRRVPRRLLLRACESRACGLGLNGADRPAVDEKKVVDAAMRRLEDELPYGDTLTGGQIDRVGILDQPPGRVKLLVDLDSSLSLGREVRVGARMRFLSHVDLP